MGVKVGKSEKKINRYLSQSVMRYCAWFDAEREVGWFFDLGNLMNNAASTEIEMYKFYTRIGGIMNELSFKHFEVLGASEEGMWRNYLGLVLKKGIWIEMQIWGLSENR